MNILTFNKVNIVLSSLSYSDSSGWSALFASFLQLMLVILVLAFVLVAFYFFAKSIEKIRISTNTKSIGNIDIVEVKSIGYNNNLMLVRVSEKYIVISVSKDKTTFICEIDEFVQTESTNDISDFKNIFDKFLNRNADKE